MDIDYNEKDWATPCPKYDCKKTACKCGLEYVYIPSSLGDDSEESNVAPKNGAYCNALVFYEANGHVYIYTKEGVPTLIDVDASDISMLEQEVIKAQKDVHELREDIDDFVYGFDTVAQMKAATNLSNGDRVRTLGYYEENDGGGAFYKVTNVQPSGYYEILSDLLYAELIIGSIANARQFGAKGDGVANDTAKVSYIINNFDNILFPSGTYLVNTGFTVRSNQTITGEENTIIKQADSSNILNIFSGSEVSNLKISNIKIDLNLDNQSYSNRSNQGRGILLTSSSSNIILDSFSTDRIYGSFIYIVDSSSISIKSCNIGDPDGAYSAYGVYVVRCQHVLCEKCVFSGVRDYGVSLSSYGFYSKDTGLDIVVQNCRFNKMQCMIDGSKNDGTASTATSVKIINNLLIDTPADTTIRYAKYGLMSDNITRGSGDYGLSVGDSEYITVSNNVVEGSNTVGIGIRVSPHCIVEGNTIINPCQNFRNLDLVSNQRDGIYVLGNSRRCNVCNNIITDTNSPARMYSGVRVEDISGGVPGADASFAVVCNNVIYGASNTPIIADNSTNIIANNYPST